MVTSADPAHPHLHWIPAPLAFQQVVGQCALNVPVTISTAAVYPGPADRAIHLKHCHPMQQEIGHMVVLLGWAGSCFTGTKNNNSHVHPSSGLTTLDVELSKDSHLSLFSLCLEALFHWLLVASPTPPLGGSSCLIFLFPSTPLLWHLQLSFALNQSLPNAWLPSSCCRAQEKDDIARGGKYFEHNTVERIPKWHSKCGEVNAKAGLL